MTNKTHEIRAEELADLIVPRPYELRLREDAYHRRLEVRQMLDAAFTEVRKEALQWIDMSLNPCDSVQYLFVTSSGECRVDGYTQANCMRSGKGRGNRWREAECDPYVGWLPLPPLPINLIEKE